MRHWKAARAIFAALLASFALSAAAQPTLTEISLVPATSCVQSPVATVKLSARAPQGGLVIQLTSSVPGVISVPASVTVATGQISTTFGTTCTPPAQTVSVTLTATSGGVTRTASLNVLGPSLNSIALGVRSSGSASIPVTVTLLGPAPARGVIVALTSSNPAVAAVPVSVAVSPGQNTAVFTVTTVSVAQSATATISATLADVTRSVTLTVAGISTISDGTSNTVGFTETVPTSPSAVPASVGFQSGLSSFVPSRSIAGGQNLQARVTLNGIAGGSGVSVTLSSSNPSVATVPASVTVPAGQNAAVFIVNTLSVSQTSTATITASVSPVSRSAILTTTSLTSISDGTSNTVGFTETQPAAPPSVPASVSFQSGVSTFVPSRTIAGGQNVQAKVTMNGIAGRAGVSVALNSSNPAVANVPASVIVPAGQNSALFTVTTVSVAQSAAVTITAIVGTVSRSATLTVTGLASINDGTSNTVGFTETQPAAPAVPTSVSFQSGPNTFVSSRTIIGRENQQARVTMNGIAGGSGVSVALNSSNPAVATVPTTVTVPAGQNSALFNVTTVAVAQSATVTITAIVGTVSRSATLTVSVENNLVRIGVPVGPSSLTVTPARVQGGSGATGRVSAVASSVGFVVQLSTNDTTVATVPPSVSFSAGETVKTFAITTNPVAQARQLTITGKTNQGLAIVSRAGELTVDPPAITGLSLSQDSAAGNSTVTGKVTLSGPAPTDLPITISTSDAAAARATTAVVFPKGSSTGTFSLLTGQVRSDVSVTITASLGRASRSATLKVTP